MRRRAIVMALVATITFGCTSARSSHAAAAQPSQAPSASASASAASSASSGAIGSPEFIGTHFPTQGHTHLTPGEPDDFVYNSNPPTSGPHRELFADALITTTPLPSYIQVHLLEHGNVLLQYHCTCPDVIAALTAIANQYNQSFAQTGTHTITTAQAQAAQDQGKAVIVAPYPRMQSRIALTAWTYLATLPNVDRPKVESFIRAHLGNPTD